MATYRNFVQTMIEDKLTGATIKALLVTSTYTYNEDTHDFLNDITGEVSAGGYSRQTLTGVSVDYDAAQGVVITADNLNFGTFNATNVLGPIFFIDTGTPSTSELICADVQGEPSDLTASTAAIYRIDPTAGFLLARL